MDKIEYIKDKWNNLNKKGKTLVVVVSVVVLLGIIQSKWQKNI
jgi:hypothetical protein